MTEERDYVAEATAQGWDENYEGENKVDAQVFVEKGEKIAAIAQSQRNKAQAENALLADRIAKLESANKEFGEYKDAQLARSEARNKDLLNELSLRRDKEAAADDLAAFSKTTYEMEQVRENLNVAPPRPTNGGNEPNPLYDAWLINNDWYNTDPKLRAIADGIEGKIGQSGYSGQAYYDEVTRQVKAMSPDSFGNKKRSGTTEVELGGELETKPASDAHVYDNLPPDAKAACDKFIASGHTTKESYCATYEWD